MDKGICIVSVAALRAGPSHQSEMISQLLYGETLDILEADAKFIKIKMHFDGFEGWVDVQQIGKISNEYFDYRKTAFVDNSYETYTTSQGKILLSIGSEVNSDNESKKILTSESIAHHAQQFLNVPFLANGRSFFGVDCSGFVQLIYKVHDIALPRKASEQAEIGEVLSFVEESKPGDLVFFDNEEGTIDHVGMVLNNHEVIHCFGKVRIDSIDSTGIFNQDLKKHTHQLRFIRSIF